MKTATIEIEEKVDELLVCLEADVRHIQESLSNLNELRSLVIKRDDTALEKLLENIRAESSRYADHESARQSMRKELADILCCSFEQMTLSALKAYLPQAQREQVARVQRQLKALTKELKKEHLRTTLLLSECARFNSLLLRSIFDLGQTGAVYYNSNGAARRQMDTAFMNLQL
ncbi:MAG: hypothetical protein AMJ65_00725 [Phycisphaerae bacterium SG8_4]|nr:MAG: hypothetical protein AMJ65_00725 [Phycisphaerae bacterium SG8_4]